MSCIVKEAALNFGDCWKFLRIVGTWEDFYNLKDCELPRIKGIICENRINVDTENVCDRAFNFMLNCITQRNEISKHCTP